MSGRPSDDYIKSNPYGVRVGQLWRSKDPRETRVIVVREVGAMHARVAHPRYGQSTTRIRLDQFRRWERQENMQAGQSGVTTGSQAPTGEEK